MATVGSAFESELRPRRWTANEYIRLTEEGFLRTDEHLELIEGEIVEKMSPQNWRHQKVVSNVIRWMLPVMPSGFSFVTQASVKLSGITVAEPDIAVLRVDLERLRRIAEGPEIALAVEVMDTTRFNDQFRKPLIYAAAGIAEYWVVNLPDRLLEVHRDPSPEGYRSIRKLDERQTTAPLFAPESSVLVSALLPRDEPEEVLILTAGQAGENSTRS